MAYEIESAILHSTGNASQMPSPSVPSGQQATGTGISTQEFPEETRRLIQSTEFPLLADFLGQEAATTQPFGGAATSPFVAQQYGQAAPNLALAAGRESAAQGGIGDFGPISEETSGMAPQLINALRQLTLARGAQTQSVIQPGYGNFLAPSSFNISAKQREFNPFKTGFDLASGFTNIASSISDLTSNNTST